jgi:Fe2+ or Zn2+ uptake regulation protein
MNTRLDEQMRSLLKAKSQRITPARVAVLEVLFLSKKPLTVQNILERLRGNVFDQATVYRTLATLKKINVIRQIDFHHDHAYFELASRQEHHHAICIGCNAVEDIKDCCASTMERVALAQSGFASIRHHSLEFFGVCKSCATAAV